MVSERRSEGERETKMERLGRRREKGGRERERETKIERLGRKKKGRRERKRS